MSAARSPSDWPRTGGPTNQRAADVTRLRARRREARRRRRVARIDLGLGVAAALVLLLVSPGLAITGLITLAILLLLGVWTVRDRRRASRADAQQPPRGEVARASRGTARAPRRAPERPVRDRARSTR